MSTTTSLAGRPQSGIVAVEFALVVIIFMTFVFGVLELTRAMYMINTIEEVTRRAAAAASNTDFRDASAKDKIRMTSIFRTTAGELPLGTPVTDASVVIDYLSVSRGVDGSLILNHIPDGSLPSCPARNRLICLNNPYDPSCIQFVRTRICASSDGSGSCEPVRYQMMFPLIDLPMNLPTAVTIVPAGSLGYRTGDYPCP